MFKILQTHEIQLITGGFRIGGVVGEQLKKFTDDTVKTTTAECLNGNSENSTVVRSYHADNFNDGYNFCCKDGKREDGGNYASVIFYNNGIKEFASCAIEKRILDNKNGL